MVFVSRQESCIVRISCRYGNDRASSRALRVRHVSSAKRNTNVTRPLINRADLSALKKKNVGTPTFRRKALSAIFVENIRHFTSSYSLAFSRGALSRRERSILRAFASDLCRVHGAHSAREFRRERQRRRARPPARLMNLT